MDFEEVRAAGLAGRDSADDENLVTDSNKLSCAQSRFRLLDQALKGFGNSIQEERL